MMKNIIEDILITDVGISVVFRTFEIRTIPLKFTNK